jgi:hypothetical protein
MLLSVSLKKKFASQPELKKCHKQCCGSRMMFIPDPDFCPSRIQELQQKRGVKKNMFSYCSHKYNKIENYFIFELMTKKIWANLQKIIGLFTQKFVIKLSKIKGRIRDP